MASGPTRHEAGGPFHASSAHPSLLPSPWAGTSAAAAGRSGLGRSARRSRRQWQKHMPTPAPEGHASLALRRLQARDSPCLLTSRDSAHWTTAGTQLRLPTSRTLKDDSTRPDPITEAAVVMQCPTRDVMTSQAWGTAWGRRCPRRRGALREADAKSG